MCTFCIYSMIAYTLLKMMKKIVDDEIINNLPASFQILYKMIQEAEVESLENKNGSREKI